MFKNSEIKYFNIILGLTKTNKKYIIKIDRKMDKKQKLFNKK
jgi:hypothetical protein